MKTLLFTLLMGFFALNLAAQNCAKEDYDTYLKKAEKILKVSEPNYLAAVNAYIDALTVCPEKDKIAFVNGKLKEIFAKIDTLRVKAEKAEKATKTALVEVEKQKEVAQTNLDKANKLINAFYFYDDKFALAYGGDFSYHKHSNVFQFMDKDGNIAYELGEWDKAEQFEKETGFAKVKKGNREYILDTLGNKYDVSYSLTNMDSSIVALDLSDVIL